MALFSPQLWFCNCCGRRCFSPPSQAFGRDFRVCSAECIHEMVWRQALSTANRPYYPNPITGAREEKSFDRSAVATGGTPGGSGEGSKESSSPSAGPPGAVTLVQPLMPCGCHCKGGCGDLYAACMWPCDDHLPW